MSKSILFLVCIIAVGTLLYFLPSILGIEASVDEGYRGESGGEALEAGVVYVSYDGGAQFQAGDIDAQANVFDVDFSPIDNRAYLATDGGVFVSDDGGKRWYRAFDADGILEEPITVYRFVADPQKPGVVYFSFLKNGNAYLYSSPDGLSTLEKIYESSEGIAVYDAELRGDYLYLGMSNGEILRYQISEGTYRGLGALGDPITDLVIKSNGALYAATKSEGVFASLNGGASWEPLSGEDMKNLAGALSINDFGSQDHVAGALYAASAYGLFKTTNYGKTWTVLNTVVPQNSSISSVFVTDAGIIYAAKNNVLYKSKDGGSSWAILTPVQGRKISLIKGYDGGRVVFIGTSQPDARPLLKGFSPIKFPIFAPQ
ncbi:MAG: hypothetical protein A2939_04770 [Parcubacteria group bacterium RIFCSPLOWO2_01_FULL_48_18]|nr:MAG: hypothetical protein A3J67_00500 [Parcubacteria group bacterium RIFCSPHIGHO2_02_FULL_48_10b]OHB21670.1 MAG: hypothetical protein A2939_04770 [Parcubacteria group bacterium RIFCSPLOWO2_01_FULL_48_18]